MNELTQVDIGVWIERHTIAFGPLESLLDLIDGLLKPMTLIWDAFVSTNMILWDDTFVAFARTVASFAYRRAWFSNAFDFTLPALQASC